MKLLKNLYKPFLVLMLLIASNAVMAQTDDDDMDNNKSDMSQNNTAELMSDSEKAKAEFSNNNPNLAQLFDNSVGYVIFPNVGKGSFILGGASGNGVMYENGKAMGLAELRQVDIGFQIGGQAFREAILFQTQEQLNNFKQGNYKLTGDATAVMMEKGKSKGVDFTNGRAIVIMPKAGAMIGISVGGQKFEYRDMK